MVYVHFFENIHYLCNLECFRFCGAYIYLVIVVMRALLKKKKRLYKQTTTLTISITLKTLIIYT